MAEAPCALPAACSPCPLLRSSLHFHIQQKIPNCVSMGKRKARSLFIPVKGNLGVDEDAAEIPHLAEFGLWVMPCSVPGLGVEWEWDAQIHLG